MLDTKTFIDNIDPIINCIGTVTRLGGSRLVEASRQEMTRHSGRFFDMMDLEKQISDRVAESFGVESACITAGAAAGLALVSAGCMNKGDLNAVRQLPDTQGLPNEVVIMKSHRILYDQAVRVSGAQFHEVGNTAGTELEQVKAAITEKTAMVLYVEECRGVRGSLELSDVAKITAEIGVPLVVDAAAEMPPFTRPRELIAEGADAVLVSGGKELRGPQSSGIVLGRSDITEWCRQNNFPRYGIGRCMKMDRETLIGIDVAVSEMLKRSPDEEYRYWQSIVDRLFSELKGIKSLALRIGYSRAPSIQPITIPRLFIKHVEIHASTIQQKLAQGSPSILSEVDDDQLVINPQCLDISELDAIVTGIVESVK